MTLNEKHVRRDQSKRPYTKPRLEKLTPSAAKERLATVLPQDPSIEQMIRDVDQIGETNSSMGGPTIPDPNGPTTVDSSSSDKPTSLG